MEFYVEKLIQNHQCRKGAHLLNVRSLLQVGLQNHCQKIVKLKTPRNSNNNKQRPVALIKFTPQMFRISTSLPKIWVSVKFFKSIFFSRIAEIQFFNKHRYHYSSLQLCYKMSLKKRQLYFWLTWMEETERVLKFSPQVSLKMTDIKQSLFSLSRRSKILD